MLCLKCKLLNINVLFVELLHAGNIKRDILPETYIICPRLLTVNKKYFIETKSKTDWWWISVSCSVKEYVIH